MAGSDYSNALRGVAGILMLHQQRKWDVEDREWQDQRDMENFEKKQRILAMIEEDREKRAEDRKTVHEDFEERDGDIYKVGVRADGTEAYPAVRLSPSAAKRLRESWASESARAAADKRKNSDEWLDMEADAKKASTSASRSVAGYQGALQKEAEGRTRAQERDDKYIEEHSALPPWGQRTSGAEDPNDKDARIRNRVLLEKLLKDAEAFDPEAARAGFAAGRKDLLERIIAAGREARKKK